MGEFRIKFFLLSGRNVTWELLKVLEAVRGHTEFWNSPSAYVRLADKTVQPK